MRVVTTIALALSFFICEMGKAQDITWYKHIAPIIHHNCTPCHRTGEAAPFSLLTYDDVAKRASMIQRVTEARYMPPWKPDPHYAQYANERRLSAADIAMIANWTAHDMPKGNATDAREEDLQFVTGTRYNRKPDIVLQMKNSYHLEGDNKDHYIVYKIPFELADSMNVEGIEFITNNRKVIHHANYEIDDVPGLDLYNTVDYIDHETETTKYFENFVPYRSRIRYFGGWIPGASMESYPKHIGWVMPKRGVILLTLHYAPLGKAEDVISGVQIWTTTSNITRQIKNENLGSGSDSQKDIQPFFYLPPDVVRTFTLNVKTGEDKSLLYVWPHMHMLGKVFKAYAIKPNKDTIPLVHIPAWDFNWQEIYWFPKMLKIPKGSTIHIECTYDNTINNPYNPNLPPALVMENMNTNNEMMTLVMVTLPYQDGDENISLEK
ncbi:monooxygenase [Chitinophaga sancti]|uniref:monooxygenase n=1 Tax=Chitinophaga sancti TaxID=1004 RepID=UPI003F794EBE